MMNKRVTELIDQEIVGTISETDRDELFSAMMEDPEIAEELARREQLLVERISRPESPDHRTFLNFGHAASFLLGAVVVWAAGSFFTEPRSGFASVNVYQVDNQRGLIPTTIHIKQDTPWVTLMTYPFAEAGALREAWVTLDSLEVAGVDPQAALSDDWHMVWEQSFLKGDTQTLALMLPSSILDSGMYRIRVYDINTENLQDPIYEVVFEIERAQH